MTAREAAQKVKQFLQRGGLHFERVSGSTVSFSDLGRCSKVFVTVHGWRPSPEWDDVEEFARSIGCIAQAKGEGFIS